MAAADFGGSGIPVVVSVFDDASLRSGVRSAFAWGGQSTFAACYEMACQGVRQATRVLLPSRKCRHQCPLSGATRKRCAQAELLLMNGASINS